MKKITLLAILAIAAFSNNANAQSTADANATVSATIIAPIAITKTVDLNFGNIATDGTAATVQLLADGSRIESAGATLPGGNSTVKAAEFKVTGEGAYAFTVTLPADDTITITNGTSTNDMKVNKFTSNSTGKLVSGKETFSVGATLNINGSQPTGTYTNDSGFDVIVSYN
ncbi:DUF4402 domain-containing protein [Flavobacterium hiemivividum]|uniref:DUF4402 domain-containing protein n=1 Tax=Flavobacterium hiemivividum TaxID=2541734 RepID=A0A4R5CQI9_9FLAO|nr:DUF4402 domain-containing protein [Flavobacterium hiemivividum]TDE01590.1 DUF4402 domain-containing protein [Flavobacterium hiemivividum]